MEKGKGPKSIPAIPAIPEIPEITNRLSNYKQQFIPKKVLGTFDSKKVQKYTDIATKPDIFTEKYNDYERIVGFLYELKRTYPQLVKVIEIGKTYEKRSLLVIKVSPPGGNVYDRIFIEGGIHANEWISPNSVIYFIKYLVTNWDDLPFYMKTKTWLILPLANPDGYVYTRSSKEHRMWRKNRAPTGDPLCPGVDLNRNFSSGWDMERNNRDPCAVIYKGKQPFSEKETQAIRDFLYPQRDYLKGYIAFHSFGQEIRYMWILSTPLEDKERIKEVARKARINIAKASIKGKKTQKGQRRSAKCYYKVLNYPVMKSFQRIMVGLARDWARKNLNIKYAYTVELRDKGKKGLLLKPTFIERVGTDVYAFVEAIAKGISDDFKKLKKQCFITQNFDCLLDHRSHLFHRRPPF